METIKEETRKKKVPVISVDEQELRSHVSEVVRQSVEETLNGLLEAETDALCQARRYERNAQRASTRVGHYERELQTKAGTFLESSMSVILITNFDCFFLAMLNSTFAFE